MKTASEILREYRIITQSSAIGRYYAVCPECSHKRRKKKDPCLGVTITSEGVKFGCNHCGWTGGWKYEDAVRNKCFRSEPLPAKPTSADDSKRSEFPLRLWDESIEADHPLLRTYFDLRRLTLPDRHSEVLRFHPNCPFGEGVRHPCMISLFRDIRTNEPKAIHRTALTPDGRKIGRKSLGPIAGCAIKLTPDEDVAEGLTVGEGIETTLAGMALNFKPAWALGSAGAIERFPVLSGIDCLTILVDHDASGTGQESAMECSKRWTAAGREVFRIVPTAVGDDIADVVCGRAA
jgi:hypothetical protein